MSLTRLIASVVFARRQVAWARAFAILALGLGFGTAVRAADLPADVRIEWSSIVVSREELVCLAANDYWEARSEVIAGRIAVGRVVLNRAMDRRFPSNLCDVIKQSKIDVNGASRCQFSWVCDPRLVDIPDSKEWRDSIKIAVALTQKDSAIPDPTGGALWYHADFLRPIWAEGFKSTTIIGTHVFYREPDGARTAAEPRKPFIYRLNAFAEFAAKRNTRVQVAANASAVPVKPSPVDAQPVAR